MPSRRHAAAAENIVKLRHEKGVPARAIQTRRRRARQLELLMHWRGWALAEGLKDLKMKVQLGINPIVTLEKQRLNMIGKLG